MKQNMENQLEELLDSPASPSLVRRLVWAGVVPSRKFVAALVLCRDNSFLKQYGMLLLSLACLAYAVAAVGVLLSAIWDTVPSVAKIVFAFAVMFAFAIGAWRYDIKKPKGRALLFGACFGVGFLFAVVNSVCQVGIGWWGVFAWWSVAVIAWVIMAQSALLSLLWLVIFNLAVVFWGYEIALPSAFLRWPDFFGLLALVNGCFLAAREWLVLFGGQKWLSPKITRLTPLLFSLVFAAFPVVGYIIEMRGSNLFGSLMIFILLFLLGFVFFYRIFKDLYALSVIVFSASVVLCVWWFREYLISIYFWYFLFSGVFIIFGFASWLLTVIKGAREGGEDA